MNLVSYIPLWWLLAVVPLAGALAVSLVDRTFARKLAAWTLRVLAVVLLTLGLCRPFVDGRSAAEHVVFIVDVSQSIDLADAHAAATEIDRRISQLSGRDSWSMFTVGASLRQTDPKALQRQLGDWADVLADDTFRSQSRLADALLACRTAFPLSKAKRVILYSDGRETSGDLPAALDTLAQEGVNVLVRPLRRLDRPEMFVQSVQPSSPTAHQGEVVRLAAELSANREMEATVGLFHRGVDMVVPFVNQEGPIADNRVRLLPGQTLRVWADAEMLTAGRTNWQVRLTPTTAADDHFPVNNQSSATVNVRGRARVLAIHRQPAELRELARALRTQGIDLEVRGERGLPGSLQGMLEFDAIVLADLPATSIESRQMTDLKRYVSDFGGGLAMLGSENSFGLGGYYKTPVEDVLPLVSRFEKEKEQPSMAMVLVIDKSGSMEGMPVALAKQAAKAAVELLGSTDQVAVVAFDSEAYTVVNMTHASSRDTIQSSIDRIAAGGGTNMYPAMTLARQHLSAASARIKHMIVLTDGQSMPGPFIDLAGELADSGVTVSTVALGDGADGALLAQIAKIGRGRYYETADPANVPRIFTKETMEASRSAIKEDPFAPVVAAAGGPVEGIDLSAAPFLFGYVMTQAKPTARVHLLTETGDPLLASGQFGLGKTVAFTSDASPRWAAEWLRWKLFGQLWAQVLRSIARDSDSAGLSVSLNQSADELRFMVRAAEPDGSPANGIEWKTIAADEDGRSVSADVQQIGLGLYQVRVPRRGQELAINLQDVAGGRTKVLTWREDYPAEYRLNAEPPTGFAALPTLRPDEATPPADAVATSRPAQDGFLLAALAAMLAGLALRRI